MRPEVRDVWIEVSTSVGNASSLHTAGRGARRVVEESRESIAASLNVRPSEVIFTSGGTEADNLAVKGTFWARQSLDSNLNRVLASAIEHHAVLDPVEWLEKHEGADVKWLDVDAWGRVDLAVVRQALATPGVALCSVMWANNEVGTIQDVATIAGLCADAGVPFHTDAVQAFGQIPLDLNLRGLAAVSLSGHKIGGPMGVGALIARRDLQMTPLAHGGGQEREVRSGTLDVPAIAGFAEAVRLGVIEREKHAAALETLRNSLIARVTELVPGATLSGDPTDRLPNNAHFTFAGCEGDALLMLLDAAGIHVSTGSACTSGVPEPSHVLLAMGVSEATARGSLRFSLGRTSTQSDIDRLAEVLPAVVERAGRAGVLSLARSTES
jgi:cysteine desulfurase